MDNLHIRLKKARKAAGFTLEEVGKVFGINKSSVSLWESNKPEIRTRPAHDKLERLSKLYRVKLSELLGVSDEPFAVAEQRPDYHVSNQRLSKIPLLSIDDVKAYYFDRPLEYLTIDIKASRKAFAVRYYGEEMIGPGGYNIPDQSIIVIDPEKKPEYKKPVVAIKDDELLVRNYALSGSSVVLQASNTNYPTTPLGDGNILGAVIYVLLDLS